jgi:hypothetical protein
MERRDLGKEKKLYITKLRLHNTSYYEERKRRGKINKQIKSTERKLKVTFLKRYNNQHNHDFDEMQQ